MFTITAGWEKTKQRKKNEKSFTITTPGIIFTTTFDYCYKNKVNTVLFWTVKTKQAKTNGITNTLNHITIVP